MSPGDVLGHEAIGIVLEVGRDITQIRPGDRVVIPFQISCGQCWMCERSLYTQCETTQVRGEGSGAALFGYSKLYGQVPGGQAEYLRGPEAQFTHILVPDGPPDDRFIYLSDVLPTAWQAVEYAGVPDGGSLLILGWDRSATWRAGSPSRSGSIRSLPLIWLMSAWLGPLPVESR
jgi:threonine dehydrogenase-like Zn-dependent dehydrogenase